MFRFILCLVSTLLHSFSPSKRYTFVGRLYGHKDSVQLLRGTGTIGSYAILASVGKDGVQLWRLPALTKIPIPDPQHARRGTVSCLTWATDTRHAPDILVLGTSLGFLVIWKRMSCTGNTDFQEIFSRGLGNGGEIVSVDIDTAITDTLRVVSCARDGNLQAWDFDELGNITPVFSICLDLTIPHAAYYATLKDSPRCVVVLAYKTDEPGSGILVTVKADDGAILETQFVAGSGEISSSAFCEARQIMVFDNNESGFDLCDVNKCAVIRHLPLRTKRNNVRSATQVAFAEGSRFVVGGSDHGIAYIYDRRTGVIVDTVYHALDGDTLVQTVAACDVKDTTFIFTANSSRATSPSIAVWKYDRDESATPTPLGFFHTLKAFFSKVFQVVTIISFAAFVSQNLGYTERIRVAIHKMTADAPQTQANIPQAHEHSVSPAAEQVPRAQASRKGEFSTRSPIKVITASSKPSSYQEIASTALETSVNFPILNRDESEDDEDEREKHEVLGIIAV